MRKLPLPLLVILFFTSCQKQISKETTQEEIAGVAKNKQAKVMLCHYDPVTKSSKTIEVPQNAVAGHLAHGDLEGDCSNVLVTICEQDWTKRNLDVDHYQNGDPIPLVLDPVEWDGLTTGAYCYTDNATYGKLYNWYAISDPRGLTPEGWHVPSNIEWNNLETCVGGVYIAGGSLKETGYSHWAYPNAGATDLYGFTALPGGYRLTLGTWTGEFGGQGYSGAYWSSTENNNYLNVPGAIMRSMSYGDSYLRSDTWPKTDGFAIRCIRD